MVRRKGVEKVNYADIDRGFKREYSYDAFNQIILDKIIAQGNVCQYYIADFSYNNMERTEPFYIDFNTYDICWIDDWYEGGDIECFFGFVDSKTIGEIVKHYLWANRYRGGFNYEINHN